MPQKLFIAGTDTGAGKTYISAGLLKAYQRAGFSAIGVKPLATGCDSKTDDATALISASSIQLDRGTINPFAFAPAIAPHIAAQFANVKLSEKILHEKTRAALSHPADVHIIEGVGGWYTPLNNHETMADWVRANHFPVILVVGIRLGCINHAILTVRAMLADKVNVIGWIANCIDPHMEALSENIDTLDDWLPIPRLDTVTFGSEINLSGITSQISEPTCYLASH